MTNTDPIAPAPVDVAIDNTAVISTAQTAASNVETAVQTAASSVATAVQADAERLAVKDEGKASSWLHRELEAFEAKIAALFAEFRAKF